MSKPGSRSKKPAAAKLAKAGQALSAQSPPAADQPGPLELPADLRIASAAQMHADIVGRAERGELVLDGSRVAKLDAAGVQALLSALLQISRSGGGWRWHNPSTVLVQGVTVLGLGESLRLP